MIIRDRDNKFFWEFDVNRQMRPPRLENPRIITDHPEIDRRYNSPSKKTPRPSGGSCAKCKEAPVVTWMGIRWHGLPWPLRQWYRQFYEPYPGLTWKETWHGCGCIVKLKALVEAWRLWKRA